MRAYSFSNLLCLRYFQAVCENKKLFDHLNMEWIIGPGPKDHTSVMDFNVSFRYLHCTLPTLYQSMLSPLIMILSTMIHKFHNNLALVLSNW